MTSIIEFIWVYSPLLSVKWSPSLQIFTKTISNDKKFIFVIFFLLSFNGSKALKYFHNFTSF